MVGAGGDDITEISGVAGTLIFFQDKSPDSRNVGAARGRAGRPLETANTTNTGNPGMDTLLSNGHTPVQAGQASVQPQSKYLRN